MFHRKRKLVVVPIATAQELADKLTNYTWCCCNGFSYGGLWFLNDSTSPDGAAEFAVVDALTRVQVESVTFGWCSKDRALELILGIFRNVADDMPEIRMGAIENVVQTPEEHGRCGHCA